MLSQPEAMNTFWFGPVLSGWPQLRFPSCVALLRLFHISVFILSLMQRRGLSCMSHAEADADLLPNLPQPVPQSPDAPDRLESPSALGTGCPQPPPDTPVRLPAPPSPFSTWCRASLAALVLLTHWVLAGRTSCPSFWWSIQSGLR